LVIIRANYMYLLMESKNKFMPMMVSLARLNKRITCCIVQEQMACSSVLI
jgi:hypothetical protein